MDIIERSVTGVFAISVLLLVIGLVSFFNPQPGKIVSLDVSPTVVERQLAINQAKVSSQNFYHFTTNFIPGLGRIGDLDSYRRTLEQQQPAP